MTKSLIVGFEGPSLAGKTTIVEELYNQLRNEKYPIFCINEYVKYAKGHENFPPLFPDNDDVARQSAEYFINLECKRYQELQQWLDSQNNDLVPIVLVDRLLVTCLAKKRDANDLVGYKIILNAIKKNRMIIPDITIFLMLNVSRGEYERRLKERVLFENWDKIYNPKNEYEKFFRHFNDMILNINTYYSESSDVDKILSLIKKADKHGF